MSRLRCALLFAAAVSARPVTAQVPQGPPLPPEMEAALPPAPVTEPAVPSSDTEETGALSDVLPDRIETLPLPGTAEDPSTAGENPSPETTSLFPPEIWSRPPEELPEADSATPRLEIPAPGISEPLPPDIVAACFGAAPPPPLFDPQGLLTSSQAAALLTLVRDSLNTRGTFQTSIVVLKPSQQIPVTLNPADLLQRWHGPANGLLVLYFMGQPDRTQAFFSPETRRHYRGEDLRQVIDFSVREAARMNLPVQQLQRFCYKTAIRLHRLHHQGVVTPGDELPATAAVAPAPGMWWAFAILVQAAALGAGAFWWRRARLSGGGKSGESLRFPDQDPVIRLAGPHSGGSGAVIQFGAAGHRI